MAALSDAVNSLPSSPHKSFMCFLEQPEASQKDEKWATLKSKALKRLNEDLYTTLKSGRDATPADIKKAYRKLSLLYHPDKTRIMESAELFQVITKAYEVLSDDRARASYDHRTKHKTFSDDSAFKENTPNSSRPKPPKPTPPPAPPPASSGAQTKENAKPPPPASKPAEKGQGKKAPPAPYTLKAVRVGPTEVVLSWQSRCPESEGTTFELQTREVTRVAWPKVAQGIKQTTCKKKNLEPGMAYAFTVRAVSSGGVPSAWSAPLKVDTPSSSPSSFSEPSSSPNAPPPPSSRSSSFQDSDYERRLDRESGYTYTHEEFEAYYGGSTEWHAAAPSNNEKTPNVQQTKPPPPPPPQASAKPRPPPSNWACTVCKRMNPAASAAKCGVCGTAKGYSNDRMHNIRETADAESARVKERERMRERIAESARAAERDAADKAAARKGHDVRPPPPPAAGGWARQGNPAFASQPPPAPPPPPPPPRPQTSSSGPSVSPRPSSSSSSYSTSYSYSSSTNQTSSPRPSSTPNSARSSTSGDEDAKNKAASAARKARRASMREELKGNGNRNPLQGTADVSSGAGSSGFVRKPTPASPEKSKAAPPASPPPPPPPEKSTDAKPVKSSFLAAKRAFGKVASKVAKGAAATAEKIAPANKK